MKTDNELIADFMGLEKNEDGEYLIRDFPHVHASMYCGTQYLAFDREWDWLMPVVEKIEKLYKEAFPNGDEFVKRVLAHEEPIDREYMDVVAIPISTPLKEVYESVITFIKWYNAKKK